MPQPPKIYVHENQGVQHWWDPNRVWELHRLDGPSMVSLNTTMWDHHGKRRRVIVGSDAPVCREFGSDHA